MNELPIIIFHLGNQPYVELCLKQALKYNKMVIFIGDHKFDGVEFYHYKDYNTQSVRFESIFRNFSTNGADYEKICIVRWMCIEEVMRSLGIERAFICDSDVLIYDNIDALDKKYYNDFDVGLCSSPSKNVSGSASFWNYDRLKDFVHYCFEFYSTQMPNIKKWHETYKQHGGICDMTLLYYFVHGKKDFVGLRLPAFPYYEKDITKIMDYELTFDHHLSAFGNHREPNCYKSINGMKEIKIINGKPYCFHKELNKYIRFVLLHFQGNRKKHMTTFFNFTI